MKLDVDFGRLERIRLAVGAPLVTVNLQETSLPEFSEVAIRLRDGIDIAIDEVETGTGLLSYEGEQILIYIKDHTKRPDVLDDPASGNKFHIRDCKVIDDMRARNRFARYVATTRRDGAFLIDYAPEFGAASSEETTPLLPCRVCLRELNYNGYADARKPQKDAVVRNFDIEAFFEDYSTFFANKPRATDISSITTRYTENWSSITNRYREHKDWTCEECGVCCADTSLRKWLHTHHRNGVVTDNSFRNFAALCYDCHASEPGHGHMRVPPHARRALDKARRQQKRKARLGAA